MHDEDVVSQRAQDLRPASKSAPWIEEVGDDDRQADLPRPRGELLERRAQIGRPAGLQLLEQIEDAEDAALAASGRRLVRQARGPNGDDRQPIEVREADVAERRREASRHVELRRFAPSSALTSSIR